MKKCPFCAEEIQDEAIKCKYCGEMLNKPAGKPSAIYDRNTSNRQLKIAWAIGILVSLGFLTMHVKVQVASPVNKLSACLGCDEARATHDPKPRPQSLSPNSPVKSIERLDWI